MESLAQEFRTRPAEISPALRLATGNPIVYALRVAIAWLAAKVVTAGSPTEFSTAAALTLIGYNTMTVSRNRRLGVTPITRAPPETLSPAAISPHNQLTVITGVSGSGKSSLAFDTIYAIYNLGPEQRFAAILENDDAVERWFKPVPNLLPPRRTRNFHTNRTSPSKRRPGNCSANRSGQNVAIVLAKARGRRSGVNIPRITPGRLGRDHGRMP
jgi:hypothetical protein